MLSAAPSTGLLHSAVPALHPTSLLPLSPLLHVRIPSVWPPKFPPLSPKQRFVATPKAFAAAPSSSCTSARGWSTQRLTQWRTHPFLPPSPFPHSCSRKQRPSKNRPPINTERIHGGASTGATGWRRCNGKATGGDGGRLCRTAVQRWEQRRVQPRGGSVLWGGMRAAGCTRGVAFPARRALPLHFGRSSSFAPSRAQPGGAPVGSRRWKGAGGRHHPTGANQLCRWTKGELCMPRAPKAPSTAGRQRGVMRGVLGGSLSRRRAALLPEDRGFAGPAATLAGGGQQSCALPRCTESCGLSAAPCPAASRPAAT